MKSDNKEQAIRLTKSLVQPHDLRLSLPSIEKMGWICATVESGSHFDEHDLSDLIRAARLTKSDHFVPIILENQEFIESLKIEANFQALSDFNNRFGFLNIALVPSTFRFFILCTVYDYFVVCGSVDLVETILGTSIEAARTNFFEYATQSSWTPEERNDLMKVFRYY